MNVLVPVAGLLVLGLVSADTFDADQTPQFSVDGNLTVAIIGSGNWASAVARIIGANTKAKPGFNHTVRWWVRDEALAETINEKHKNVKYLKGHKIPHNVVAFTSLTETVKEADILVFVLPHQFIEETCKSMVGSVKEGAFGISLIKGLNWDKDHGLRRISEVIESILHIDMSVLIGANIANEIARGGFSETSIGTRLDGHGEVLEKLFSRPSFVVSRMTDIATVEALGALTNVIAVAAGFCDGLFIVAEQGSAPKEESCDATTKAAIIQNMLLESWRFADTYLGARDLEVLLQSCGTTDVIGKCFGGRNREVSESFVTTKKSFEVLEEEVIEGQKLQGPLTAKAIYHALQKADATGKFPFLVAVYQICYEAKPASRILSVLQ